MANILSNSQKNHPIDLVRQNEILKAQVELEEKARREWHRKWGFLLDFDKFVLEEAAKHGVSEAEYRRWTVRRKSKTKLTDAAWEIKVTENVPKTSSGMVGWRHSPEHNLERLGRLYISPLHTLPPQEPISSIMLG